MNKQLIDLLREEVGEGYYKIRNGPLRAYAIGKRYATGIDPKKVIPTNQDAIEFMKMIDEAIGFHGFGVTTLNDLRVYLSNLGLYK